MKVLRKAGSTSNILQIFVADSSSTTGAGLTGLTNASGSLTAYYHRDTDTTATAISLVTMTVGTFTSSGFKEIDATNMPGWYQFCPPDTALAVGAKSVGLHLKGAANMAPLPIEIDLDGQVDVQVWNAVPLSTTNPLPNAVAGAANGLTICGSNAATTFATLTSTGAFTCGGASLGAVTATTVTFSGAVTFQSTFAVTGTTTLTGNVSFGGTFGVTGLMTLSNGLAVNRSSSNSDAVTFTGSGSGWGFKSIGGAASGSTAAGGGAKFVGGAASTTGGGTAGLGFYCLGGDGAATTNGASNGLRAEGGGTTTVFGGRGVQFVGSGSNPDLEATNNGIKCSSLTSTGDVSFQGSFTVSTATSLAALSCSTLTTAGAVSFGSTFGVTGVTTLAGLATGALSGTTITYSGAVAFQSTFAVTGTTTLTGAVSLGSTLGVTGTTTLAAVATSGVTITGNLAVTAGVTITQSTTDTAALVITGNGAGDGADITGGPSGNGVSIVGGAAAKGLLVSAGVGVYVTASSTYAVQLVGTLRVAGTSTLPGIDITGGNASGATPAGDGVRTKGGTASITGGGVAGKGVNAIGGSGAASTNGAGDGAVFSGGGTTTVSGGNGLTLTHTGSASDFNATTTPLTLAKTTNITGFNDIAATDVVSSGAITTSGGGVILANGVAHGGNSATLQLGSSTGYALTVQSTHAGSAGAFFGGGSAGAGLYAQGGSSAPGFQIDGGSGSDDIVLGASGNGTLYGNLTGNVGGKLLGGGTGTITAAGAWALDGAGAALGTAASVAAVKAQTDKLSFNGSGNVAASAGGTNFVHTTGKLWALDGSGNAVAPAADTAAVVAKLPVNGIADETLVIAATNAIIAAVGTPAQAGTVAAAFSSLQTHGDNTWATATGFAVPGSTMTLTAAYDAAKTAAAPGAAMTLSSAYDFAKGTVAMAESYAANGLAPSPVQALFAIHQYLLDFSIGGTSYTVKRLDNLTTAFVVTLDNATTPTGAARI